MLALAREAGEFPDEDLLEGGLGFAGLVKHPPETGPIDDASALSLVDVLADDDVPVLFGVVPVRPDLCRHRQVHVLPVAGDPGLEGRRCVVFP